MTSHNHHHGTDPIVAGLLIGGMLRQRQDAQQSEFRTLQAAYMQQGYDATTAEMFTHAYLDGRDVEPLVRQYVQQTNCQVETAVALVSLYLEGYDQATAEQLMNQYLSQGRGEYMALHLTKYELETNYSPRRLPSQRQRDPLESLVSVAMRLLVYGFLAFAAFGLIGTALEDEEDPYVPTPSVSAEPTYTAADCARIRDYWGSVEGDLCDQDPQRYMEYYNSGTWGPSDPKAYN